MKQRGFRWLVLAWGVAFAASQAAAFPLGTTGEDFKLPGTQPLTIVDDISTPDDCETCHADYGEPDVEPMLNWEGSMMAQAGRDPLMYAALAVSNQDAPESGETCLRCHLPKGWLEGRSFLADGSAMTADDRQGVQCGACHRLVDPIADAENPLEDAAILAGLSAPVPIFGGATMVVDPFERLRGPFDIVSDLGSDPHVPSSETLISPFHSSSDLCGVCHNLRNPLFTKNDITGRWELNADDTPIPDASKGFPEQSTYDEWAASEYASTGVFAPQFGGNKSTVSTCQDCHMPDVSGKDADLGLERDDVPLHVFAGANTFIPAVLPFHPAFGSEVNPVALERGIAESTRMLRKAATLSGSIDAGVLTVRVANETGHKLPTGYPEGRRMWLHVRALDAKRNVVLESGRYIFSTATVEGYGVAFGEPGHDPDLHVWEAEQGIDDVVAAATGLPEGRSFHLSLNNVRLGDNRIPPRGFTNAAFEAIDAEPVGAVYADGQYWDDVSYPVGPSVVSAEVTLYYQTASREYIEFLRDEDTTTAAGSILFDLWEEHNQSVPVEMARLTLDRDSVIRKCQKNVSKLQSKYLTRYLKEWGRCFDREVKGLPCDDGFRDAKIAQEEEKLRDRLGGVRDRSCAGQNLTPSSLGHTAACPVPCSGIVLFDLDDLASCSVCLADALGDAALEASYGAEPPSLPGTVPSSARSCQRQLDRAASGLATGWTKALGQCEADNASGKNNPALDCDTDPQGKIGKAKDKAASKVDRCKDFAGIAGCATAGDAAGVAACIEAAAEALVGPYTEVTYP